MSSEQAEILTTAQWKQRVADFDTTLAGTLDPEIRQAIEALRVHAVQQTFIAELTTPVKVDAPAQQFVTPKVPDVMPVAVAENLKMWDERIAQVEVFLKNNPLPHFIPALKELLVEAREKRAKALYDFQNPEKIPVPLPPAPIRLPEEVISLVRQIIREESPNIIAQTISWFRANPEWKS